MCGVGRGAMAGRCGGAGARWNSGRGAATCGAARGGGAAKCGAGRGGGEAMRGAELGAMTGRCGMAGG